MTSALPSHDEADRGLIYSIRRGQASLSRSLQDQRTYVAHVLIRKLESMTVPMSPLVHLVGHVDLGCAQKQMGRLATRRVVTCVTHERTNGNRTDEMGVGPPMRPHGASSHPELPVPGFVAALEPQPASIPVRRSQVSSEPCCRIIRRTQDTVDAPTLVMHSAPAPGPHRSRAAIHRTAPVRAHAPDRTKGV
jgi:hypothetical protein